MQVLKIFGLGTLFFIIIVVIQITIGIVMGKAQVATGTATGLSAITGRLVEGTVFNIYFWLTLLAAYGGAAVWVKR